MEPIRFSCDVCAATPLSHMKQSEIHWCVIVNELSREECEAVQRFEMMEHGVDGDALCFGVCFMTNEEIKWFEDREIKFHPHVSPRRGTKGIYETPAYRLEQQAEPKTICTCWVNRHHMIRRPDDDIINIDAVIGNQCHGGCDVELSHEANGRTLECTLSGFSKVLYGTLMERVHAEASIKLITKDRVELYPIDVLVKVCSALERDFANVETFIKDASIAGYISCVTRDMILRDVHCLREAVVFVALTVTHDSYLPSSRYSPSKEEMLVEWRRLGVSLMDYYNRKKVNYGPKESNRRLLEIASHVSYQFSRLEKWLHEKCNVSATDLLNCETLLEAELMSPRMLSKDRFIGTDVSAVGFKFMKHEAATFGFKILGALVCGTRASYKMRHVAKKKD